MPPDSIESGFFPLMTSTCSSAAEADTTFPTEFSNWGLMKRTLFCIFVLALPVLLSAQSAHSHHRPHAYDGLPAPAARIYGPDVGRRANGAGCALPRIRSGGGQSGLRHQRQKLRTTHPPGGSHAISPAEKRTADSH